MPDFWEVAATDRDVWRYTVKLGLSQYEETQWVKAEKRLHKKTVCLASRPTMAFICSKCGLDCHSQIGLHIHNRCCAVGANLWSHETDRCQWGLLLWFIDNAWLYYVGNDSMSYSEYEMCVVICMQTTMTIFIDLDHVGIHMFLNLLSDSSFGLSDINLFVFLFIFINYCFF